jgi:hypothetical protein
MVEPASARKRSEGYEDDNPGRDASDASIAYRAISERTDSSWARGSDETRVSASSAFRSDVGCANCGKYDACCKGAESTANHNAIDSEQTDEHSGQEELDCGLQ